MSEKSIYIPQIITKRLSFKISEIVASDKKSLHEFIEKLVCNLFEGICVCEGYIKKKSVKLISHSSGLVIKNNIVFYVNFSCDIYFPVNGDLIMCKVASVTKAGIRGFSSQEFPSPFVAFVTKDLVFEDPVFETMQVDDIFVAKVIGSRFEANDKHVSLIAEFMERKTNALTHTPKPKIRYQKQKKSRIKSEQEDDKDDEQLQPPQQQQIKPKRQYNKRDQLKPKNEKVPTKQHESFANEKHDKDN